MIPHPNPPALSHDSNVHAPRRGLRGSLTWPWPISSLTSCWPKPSPLLSDHTDCLAAPHTCQACCYTRAFAAAFPLPGRPPSHSLGRRSQASAETSPPGRAPPDAPLSQSFCLFCSSCPTAFISVGHPVFPALSLERCHCSILCMVNSAHK